MARLKSSLIQVARAEHPYLPLLLLGCRDLAKARDELRQLCEYVAYQRRIAKEQAWRGRQRSQSKDQQNARRRRFANCRLFKTPHLLQLCHQRALGKPLAYIRGSQPFANLEILCEKRVLIPRETTANYTLRIAELLTNCSANLKAQYEPEGGTFSVLDLCTGSGCIPLLLHSLLALHFPRLRIIGMDVSEHALKLAKKNLDLNLCAGKLGARAANEVAFIKHNILDDFPTALGKFDLVISNPPYATPQEYRSSAIPKSVRCYEPFEALVPNEHPDPESVSGHTYFTALDSIAQSTGAKVVVCEMGLEMQFAHVCNELKASPYWCGVEVWRDQVYSDFLGAEPRRDRVTLTSRCGSKVFVSALGTVLYRVVVGFHENWGWLNKQPSLI